MKAALLATTEIEEQVSTVGSAQDENETQKYEKQLADGVLDLSDRQIGNGEMSDVISLIELCDVYFVILKKNHLSMINQPMPSRITALDLSYNLLDGLSEKGFDSLVNLTHLNVSFNQIVSCAGLERCRLLNTLMASNNNIKFVSGLETLQELSELDLSNNRISDISGLRTLSVCCRIQSLQIKGNPVCKDRFIRQTISHILPNVIILDGLKQALRPNIPFSSPHRMGLNENVKSSYSFQYSLGKRSTPFSGAKRAVSYSEMYRSAYHCVDAPSLNQTRQDDSTCDHNIEDLHQKRVRDDSSNIPRAVTIPTVTSMEHDGDNYDQSSMPSVILLDEDLRLSSEKALFTEKKHTVSLAANKSDFGHTQEKIKEKKILARRPVNVHHFSTPRDAENLQQEKNLDDELDRRLVNLIENKRQMLARLYENLASVYESTTFTGGTTKKT
jgi:hypothetical protein